MRNIIHFFLISCLFWGCNNSSTQGLLNNSSNKNSISIIEFSKKTINLGTLSNDTIVQAEFKIRNVGSENLMIKNINTECSCTGYKLDNDTISPGDSTKLLINFNTKGKIEGFQRRWPCNLLFIIRKRRGFFLRFLFLE